MLVVVVGVLSSVDASKKMKGGKAHSRSKRTIGDIINWKVGIFQSLFGGVFGGTKGGQGSSYGPPQSSYGPPKNNKPPRNKSIISKNATNQLKLFKFLSFVDYIS